MESNSDDREPQQPPDVPPDELEEALKWLEEMTARQREPAEADLGAIAPIDSPFSGLIETEPGNDLPDWLRETPAADELSQDEPESRLDWLGKMAQRESVEEQTTVHWRHLGEPDEDTALDEAEMPPAEPMTQPLMELETDNAPPPDAIPEPFAESVEETRPTSDVWAMTTAESVETTSESGPAAVEPEWVAEDTPPAGPPVAALEALPPVDDLDAAEAAMAWIEELAVSQDAPIEDVPSVADRALASKLMLEAGLTPDIFGLESPATDFSLLEERTPVNPFAEDFADTVVLVETLVADQGGEPTFAPAVPILPGATALDATNEPPMGEEFVPPEMAGFVDDTAEPLSFDEAMDFLDDLAVEAAPASEPDTGPLSEPDEMEAAPDEATAVEALDAGEAPWAVVTASAATVAKATDDDTQWDEGAVTQPLEPITFVEEPAVEEFYVEEWSQTAPALGERLPTLIEPDERPVEVEQAVSDEVADDGAEAEWPALVELTADNLEASVPFDVAAVVASGEFIDPVEDTPMPASEPEPEYLAASNGLEATSALEATLRELDVLALPPGRTLSDVDMTLRRRAGATSRDLPGALVWLESTLEWTAEPIAPTAPAVLTPEPDLDEAELLDRMPDDPDAALAWLERIAGEEEGAVASTVPEPGAPAEVVRAAPPAAPSPPAEAWSEEANLLDMPDDPDEVMAWLEGIAQGEPASSTAANTVTTPTAISPVEAPSPVEAGPTPPPVETPTPVAATTPAVAETPVEPLAEPPAVEPSAPSPAPGVRVNLRKRRFVIREGQPTALEDDGAGWMDRLEPRE